LIRRAFAFLRIIVEAVFQPSPHPRKSSAIQASYTGPWFQTHAVGHFWQRFGIAPSLTFCYRR